LIQLVRECRIQLAGIPLAPICLEYVRYLEETGCSEIDRASAGMFGLAYLVERKAWGMIPEDAEPDELESEIGIEPTASIFAPAIEALAAAKEMRDLLFFRQQVAADGTYELPLDLSSVKTEDLARALKRLLERAAEEPEGLPARPRFSMAELTQRVLAAVTAESPVEFERLLPEDYTRMDVVWHFLAVLESVRLGFCRVTVRDERIFLLSPEKTA
jgi:chromatin segregation and condensation protein Rec8/ScpA/Scc1 (kleisin family)